MSISPTPKFYSRAEKLLAFLIVIGVIQVIVFFTKNGYLPPPFFDDTTDTFMDWYNTAYWVYKPGAYDEWGSVYPPFSFVFLRFFSNPSCYAWNGAAARQCDQLGIFAISGFFLLNFVLLYKIFQKDVAGTAIPRAIALGLGLPMLYSWERGNLIVPCFTFFILGHGRLLKAGWVRWLCVAASINFKPYLVLALAGRVLRRRWRWLEGCAVAIVIVYAVSFMVFGQGNPIALFNNIAVFSQGSDVIRWSSIAYVSTLNAILDILKSPLPIMRFIGSRPIEAMESIFPAAIGLSEIGVLTCFAGAVWRPNAVPAYRLAALSMGLLLTVSNPGSYAAIFLFFFVFQERWEGPGQIVALIATYILCVPLDYEIVGIGHQIKDSYLSGRAVGYDTGLTVGAFLRPALMLLIQYGLVAASLRDIGRAPQPASRRHRRPPDRTGSWSPVDAILGRLRSASRKGADI